MFQFPSTPLPRLAAQSPELPRSLSDLSDRREPSGRARTVFPDFEAHSGPRPREIGEQWTALPTGAVDRSQVRQAPRRRIGCPAGPCFWMAPFYRRFSRKGPRGRAAPLGRSAKFEERRGVLCHFLRKEWRPGHSGRPRRRFRRRPRRPFRSHSKLMRLPRPGTVTRIRARIAAFLPS